MKPKLFLLDEPCDKAREIFAQEFDCSKDWPLPDVVYTGLTPVNTIVPVVCPCTGIEHIKTTSSTIIYLDDEWKRGEGKYVTSTAEHTWSLILQLAKMKRMQLSRKKLGVIGIGRIGLRVINYANSFGMYECFYDNAGWGENAMIELLHKADIITLHVPLNNSTKGMIGKEQFAMMKPGALLVNTSRAKIVNEDALISALESGKLGGYADDFYMDHLVDVTEHPNVILTNHIAGNCIEAREATDIYIATKTVEWWRAQTP